MKYKVLSLISVLVGFNLLIGGIVKGVDYGDNGGANFTEGMLCMNAMLFGLAFLGFAAWLWDREN